MLKKISLPISVFISVFIILAMVQLKVERPIILVERFIPNSGWIEIIFVSAYAFLVAFKMQNPVNIPIWRRKTWILFSIVFFSQLFLGILGFENFLMTGKLHLPVPAIIMAGPIFRGKISFMTILFLSTIILSGPVWCSHLCYFGAIDAWASKGKTKTSFVKHKKRIKLTFVLLVIIVTLILKLLNLSTFYAAFGGIIFGMAGLIIIILFSRKRSKMMHCVYYCPIGTLVNYLRFINPFRLVIDSNCTTCMKCTSVCKYDALNLADLHRLKPGITCTLCGDCISSCHVNSIYYRFFKLKPETAHRLYLGLSITLHASFLALARL